MKTDQRRLTALFFLLLVGGLACGPLGPIPGGRLAGEVDRSTPSDWSFTDAHDTVQLETSGDDPYSVNIWATSVKGQLYIAAGTGEDTRWARNLMVDPLVRLRVDGRIYELRATRVELTPEIERDFLAALEKKYDFERPEDDEDDAWLFHLLAR